MLRKDKKNFKEIIQFYFIDCKTIPGKLIDVLILLLNIFFCVLFVLETYDLSTLLQNIFMIAEITLVIFFVFEYILRFYAAKNKLKFIIDIYSIIDIFTIIPTILLLIFPIFGLDVDIWVFKIIRVFKVFRIFRFFRYTSDPNFFFGNITYHLLKVLRLILTIIIIFFISSGLFYYVEKDINNTVNNLGDAFYFTVVTITTVGFGDIKPESQGGRWVTIIMILSGIILIPWQASQIIKEWVIIYSKKKVTCGKCGLRFHDKDASHCKHCGNIIYQETDGSS